MPTAEDVGRIVKWLRDPAAAPERDRLAGLLLVYTVQRRRAVSLARKADFEPAGALGGLWNLPALHRKTASTRRRRGLVVGAHVVPLPPQAWEIVRQAIKAAGNSVYLFPAMRDRRSGKPAETMHPSICRTFSARSKTTRRRRTICAARSERRTQGLHV